MSVGPTIRPLRRRAIIATATVAALTAAGCGGGDPAGDAERFCGEVQAHAAELTTPPGSEDDIDALLDLYRDIAAFAPLAVEDDWNHVVSAYETASTVVIGDVESEQTALAAIFAAEKAAIAVQRWLQDTCAVDIGPVFTIVPLGQPESVPPTSGP